MPGFGFLIDHVPATQIEVLEGIIDLLRAEFSTYEASSIYWTDYPRPLPDTNLDVFLNVHVGGGSFDPGIHAGAADGVVQEDMQFGVTIWHRSEIDQTGRFEVGMFGPEGLLAIKRRVLKALAGKYVYSGDSLITGGAILPISALEPVAGDGDQPLDSLAITFSVAFQWSFT